eukprot:TRINITY_DN6582_c0_g1_i1.p1 TRINITY_DN6582_c0_g1~~TRINITY_DN6582_c0_g1_i1.p1  ORF type:complete len:1992 (-),score=234.88 TRINITY_DN6582_c0_g1_i1:99-6074(-)
MTLFFLSLFLMGTSALHTLAVLPDKSSVLRGKDAITVIFDSAVIALGSDWNTNPSNPFKSNMQVPGKVRWVTTTIARFDPDVAWPPDLSFPVEIRATDYRGNTSQPKTANYSTSPSTFTIQKILSETASNLTGGSWSSHSNHPSFKAPECPPDGRIYLSFPFAINSTSLKKSLKLISKEGQEVPIRFDECSKSIPEKTSSSCAVVIPESPLKEGKLYDLVIPDGTILANYGGPRRGEIRKSVSGLFPFKFDFMPQTRPIQNQRLLLYLRHGLRDNETAIPLIKKAISIVPYVKFTLVQDSPDRLILYAPFEPTRNYTISVAPDNNVRDGFGLPLQASTVSFQMGKRPVFVLQTTGSLYNEVLTLPNPVEWTIFSSNTDDCKSIPQIRATKVTESNVGNTLASFVSQKFNADPDVLITYPKKIQLPSEDPSSMFSQNGGVQAGDELSVKMIPESIFDTGLWLNEISDTCRFGGSRKYSSFVTTGNLKIITIVSSKKLIVWVTDTITNTPCTDCQVTLYYVRKKWNMDSVNTQRTSSLDPEKTNSHGVAFVTLPLVQMDYTYTAFALVNRAGKTQISEPITLHYLYEAKMATEDYVGTIIHDRGFYKAGDVVHLKGYVRSSSDISAPINSQNWFLQLIWGGMEVKPEKILLKVTPLGTWDTNVTIPEGTSNGHHSVELLKGESVVAVVALFVADPRIPAAVMEIIDKEPVFKPNGPLAFNISLATYSGTALANATIDITWRIQRSQDIVPYLSKPTRDTESEAGKFQVTTGIGGIATVDFDFHKVLEKHLNPDDKVILTTSYQAPTKELLTKTLEKTVAYSDISIDIQLSTELVMPNFPWALNFLIRSLDESITSGSFPVELTIYEWQPDRNVTLNLEDGLVNVTGAPVIQVCHTVSQLGSESNSPGTCENLTIPKMGRYLLVTRTTDKKGIVVNSYRLIGRTLEEWEKNPLSDWGSISMSLDKTEYSLGESPKIRFYNPFSNAIGFLVWGNPPDIQYKLQKIGLGFQEFTFELGQESKGGSSARFVISTGYQEWDSNITVPTSVLFSVETPTTITQDLTIIISTETKDLEASIELQSPVVLPGTPTEFTVRLTEPGNNVPFSGEVAVFVVDKAVLDLMPLPLTKFNETLARVNHVFSTPLSFDYTKFVAKDTYENTRSIVFRRLTANPFLSLHSWDLFPTLGLRSDFDMSDEEYFMGFSEYITESGSPIYPIFRSRGSARFMSMNEGIAMESMPAGGPQALKMMARPGLSDSLGGGGTGDVSEPALRTNFQTTPLFLGSVEVSNGEVKIPWTTPDNIGKFEIRVYAINQEGSFGVTTTTQIVRKDLSLLPAIPRIVRTGDRFLSGVAVVINDQEFDGRVTVSLSEVGKLLSSIGETEKSMDITGAGVFKFDFKFRASGVGSTNLIFKATVAEGTLSDSAQFSQEIGGRQEPVFVATSMSVSAETPTTEGFRLPPAEAYSGELEVEAGVGKLPGILVLSRNLLNDVSGVRDPNSYSLLASLVPQVALSEYSNVPANASLLVRTGSKTSSKQILELILPDKGLVFSKHCFSFTADIHLNSFGVFVFRKTSLAETYPEKLDLMISSLNQGLINYCTELKELGQVYSNYDELASLYYYLGLSWELPSTEFKESVSFSTLLQHFESLTMSSKVKVALTMIQADKDGFSIPKTTLTPTSIMEEVTDRVRIQGRTAYIAGEHSSSPSFMGSALSLMAYTETQNTLPIVEKLANFVAQMQDVHFIFPFITLGPEESVQSLLALSNYDKSRGSTNPDLSFLVTSGSATLVSQEINSVNSTPIREVLSFEELEDPNNILFQATGRGEASVVFGTTFVPSELSKEPISRGISVQKVIRLVNRTNNEPMGAAIEKATLGTIVHVTIEITIPDFSNKVEIVDPLSGGIEALDDSFFASFSDNKPDYLFWSPFWVWYRRNAFSNEFHSDRVLFHGTSLWPGTHSVSYFGIVSSVGDFVVPPTKVFDPTQPEVMGLSAAGDFTVPEL